MNITDIQNYMFSFFGGVYFPPADLDALKELIKQEKKELGKE